jgi:hypothetical protein
MTTTESLFQHWSHTRHKLCTSACNLWRAHSISAFSRGGMLSLGLMSVWSASLWGQALLAEVEAIIDDGRWDGAPT